MRLVALELAVVFVVTACGPAEVDLLQDDRPSERLRRMNLVVEANSGTPESAVWTIATDIIDVDDLDAIVMSHCKYSVEQNPPDQAHDAFSACTGTTDKCDLEVCGAYEELCRALTFREMAEAGGEVELLLDAPSGSLSAGDPGYRLRPQSPEARVALWQASQYSAMKVMQDVRTALFELDCNSPNSNQLLDPFSSGTATLPQTTGELLASTLVEALHVGEYAADNGAQGALGVADGDRSTIADIGTAAQITWFDQNLSRLVAVQTHVGGLNPAYLPQWRFVAGSFTPDNEATYFRRSIVETGIGSQPPCTGDCATALSTIRYSGAPFDSVISSTVALDTLVATHIGPRLDARIGPGIYHTTNATALAGSIGVPVSALVQARQWMQHEAEVFARPTGINAPKPPLAEATTASFDASTMSRASAPPPMHFITAARAAGFWNAAVSIPTGSMVEDSPRFPPLRPERAHLLDYANAVAREAMATSGLLSTNAQGVLATLTQTVNARRAVELEVCTHPDPAMSGFLRLRVFGPAIQPASNEFMLVHGTTGLRCATDGAIEGVPCQLGSLTDLTTVPLKVTALSGTWTTVPTAGGRLSRLHALEWAVKNQSYDPYQYIVRLRPGNSGGAGAYEAIAGVPIPVPGSIVPGTCTVAAYDYESNESAAQASEVNHSDLAPRHMCGDIDLNGPIPLEDEIIDNGDPYENSWQHHLQVAASAAEHADALGQQLIESGLRMDERAVRAHPA